MKRWVAAALAVGAMWAQAGAQERLGLGFLIGNRPGISAKIPMGGVNSLNLLLGYDTWRGGSHVYMHGDYVWHHYGLIPVNRGKLPLYYGPGVHASLSGHSSIGIRGVVGLEYQFEGAPFAVMVEVGPGINIIPNTDFGISAGLGARFFF